MITKIMDKINVYLQLKKAYMIRSNLEQVGWSKKSWGGNKRNKNKTLIPSHWIM